MEYSEEMTKYLTGDFIQNEDVRNAYSRLRNFGTKYCVLKKDSDEDISIVLDYLYNLQDKFNELKEWFKGYHKSYSSCKWYEEDYIEFIEHLEEELKGADKE